MVFLDAPNRTKMLVCRRIIRFRAVDFDDVIFTD
jgi:hypothetical protein